MKSDLLISVIMPAFNVERYIEKAIKSVMTQTYKNWELIVVDNNSTDDTIKIVRNFSDSRIRLYDEKNQGVSHARNKGLKEMKGQFLCFLDADDFWPANSLEVRFNHFSQNPDVDFVDGQVQYVSVDSEILNKTFKPNFKGKPYERLLALDSRCLFGPSWMIKSSPEIQYEFDTDMSHAEDLFFYLTISKGKLYDYVDDTILYYRQRPDSAMKDIQGLEKGYLLLIKKIREKLAVKPGTLLRLKLKVTKIMVLSFLFNAGKLGLACKTPFKILSA